jgi:hypothetical protein
MMNGNPPSAYASWRTVEADFLYPMIFRKNTYSSQNPYKTVDALGFPCYYRECYPIGLGQF